MASFSEAPPGNPDAGAKIFKMKCAQCHTVEQGAGHKQGMKRDRSRLVMLPGAGVRGIWMIRWIWLRRAVVHIRSGVLRIDLLV